MDLFFRVVLGGGVGKLVGVVGVVLEVYQVIRVQDSGFSWRCFLVVCWEERDWNLELAFIFLSRFFKVRVTVVSSGQSGRGRMNDQFFQRGDLRSCEIVRVRLKSIRFFMIQFWELLSLLLRYSLVSFYEGGDCIGVRIIRGGFGGSFWRSVVILGMKFVVEGQEEELIIFFFVLSCLVFQQSVGVGGRWR